MKKAKFTVKQIGKVVNPRSNKIAYTFEFLKDGKPILLVEKNIPKLNEKGHPQLNANAKIIMHKVQVFHRMTLEYEAGTKIATIKQALRYLLIDLEYQAEIEPPKIEDAPDLDEELSLGETEIQI